MDIEKKITEDMKSLGCESKLKIALAFHLYMYLVDEKLMYDTEYCYNKDIDTLYIVAKPSKNDKLNIYVPIPCTEGISMNLVEILQENLCTVETGHTVNIALIESDYTTVIYAFSKGLGDLNSQDGSIKRKNREERRNVIDMELRQRKDELINNALYGGVIEDN